MRNAVNRIKSWVSPGTRREVITRSTSCCPRDQTSSFLIFMLSMWNQGIGFEQTDLLFLRKEHAQDEIFFGCRHFELWFSNDMGKVQTCHVPMLFLVRSPHSLAFTHYGKDELLFFTSRSPVLKVLTLMAWIQSLPWDKCCKHAIRYVSDYLWACCAGAKTHPGSAALNLVNTDKDALGGTRAGKR